MAEGLSVRATEELISLGSSQGKSGTGLKKSSLSKYSELEEKIENALDTRVRIKGGKNGGRIQIEFADGADLQRITAQIIK